MTEKNGKKSEVTYEVVVRLDNGRYGAYEPGEIVPVSELAAYIPEENIKALAEAGVIKEHTDG